MWLQNNNKSTELETIKKTDGQSETLTELEIIKQTDRQSET